MKITYKGHSCFTVEQDGFVIGFDPYDPGTPGYEPLHIEVNELYCSHGHGDHSYTAAASIKAAGAVSPFEITELTVPHDDEGGAKRGMNTVRIVKAAGKKIAHFGDTGCMPSEEQLEALSGCDLVMIPVGGFFTIDADTANRIVDIIQPGLAVPMHYRKGNCGYEMIADIDDIKLGQRFRVMEYGESLEI